MIEQAAEHDEELMDLYVHNQPIEASLIRRANQEGDIKQQAEPCISRVGIESTWGYRDCLTGIGISAVSIG